ncbi:MAG: molybdopterin-synthase adenylyltransferase MoeB [Gammaproteobacteria bacterium]|nr:molybdopterin-synthase adenylyltransferase MoeB [Gammaproteobacteria bacterium]MDH5660506.1 molybdopterin-synthase adenylyltransferase MoeB [Gammaproteobacteria bacterium]
MEDEQLLRYSRQIMLPQIDVAGQEKLLSSRVLIIGMGGLGSPIAMYLAAAGIGHLVLVDDDSVELSNLQRQIAHGTTDIGLNKVESAKQTIEKLNPEIKITTYAERLEDKKLSDEIAAADIVIDGTDNFTTRFALNDSCVQNNTPLVSGAAIRMEGQVSVFNKTPSSPCYRCLYKDEGELDTSCSANGVLSPVVGIIGSIQATEAIKVLLDIGETLDGKLLVLDALHMEWRTLKLKKDPSCPVCG